MEKPPGAMFGIGRSTVVTQLGPAASSRKSAREREVNWLGQHLDGSRVVLGLELDEVDGGLAADEDATDEVGPVPGDPVALGIGADNELRVPDLREDGRNLITHGEKLSLLG
jgi:hypothetical protein